MWTDIGLRFVLGGVIISFFALLGDLCKPKSFAGLFSAAPSVALATLGLTFFHHGGAYTSLEGRSMLVGGVALFVYCQLVSYVMMRRNSSPMAAASGAMFLWFGTAFGIWFYTLQ